MRQLTLEEEQKIFNWLGWRYSYDHMSEIESSVDPEGNKGPVDKYPEINSDYIASKVYPKLIEEGVGISYFYPNAYDIDVVKVEKGWHCQLDTTEYTVETEVIGEDIETALIEALLLYIDEKDQYDSNNLINQPF